MTPAAPRGLAELLDKVPSGNVVTVVAPAGTGKSTAVQNWAERRDELLVAASLADPGTTSGAWEELLANLPTRPSIVVLDDLDAADPAVVERALLDACSDGIPAATRLVLVSRRRPPLPIARLRARRQLTEITLDDLRFDDADIDAAISAAIGRDASGAERAAVAEATGGWAPLVDAAAQMLAAGNTHDAVTVAALGTVAERFDELVAQTFGPDLVALMRSVSPLTTWTPALVDALAPDGTGRTAELVEAIEQSGIATVEVRDGARWFTVDPALNARLLSRLDADDPHRTRDVLTAAATWLERHRHPVEALAVARRLGRVATVALLERQAATLIGRGHVDLVRTELAELGDDVLTRPHLCAAWALVHTLAATDGERDGEQEIGHWLDAASAATGERRPKGGVVDADTLVLLIRVTDRIRHGSLAGAQADLAAMGVPGGQMSLLEGIVDYFHGHDRSAIDHLTRAVDVAVNHDLSLFEHYGLAGLAAATASVGRHDDAWALVERERALAARTGREKFRGRAGALLAAARVHLHRGDADLAVAALHQGQALFDAGARSLWRLELELTIAPAYERSSQPTRAARARLAALALAEECPDIGARLTALVEACWAASITGRQLDVLRLVAQGCRDADIAAELGISERTVHSHVRTILGRLGVANRTAAAHRAAELGIMLEVSRELPRPAGVN